MKARPGMGSETSLTGSGAIRGPGYRYGCGKTSIMSCRLFVQYADK